MKYLELTHLTCDCMSDAHTLRFAYDDGGGKEAPEIYTSVFLNPFPSWWRRAWRGIQYVFGVSPMYGHFDCTLLSDPEEVRKIQGLCIQFIEAHDAYAKAREEGRA